MDSQILLWVILLFLVIQVTVVQRDAGSLVDVQTEAHSAETLVGPQGVHTVVFTDRTLCQALINIIAATAVCVEPVASLAAALIAPWVVLTELTAARLPTLTLITVHTGLPVLSQLVCLVTGAERSVGGVFTVVGASSVVLLTAVHYLHLNTLVISLRRGTQTSFWP